MNNVKKFLNEVPTKFIDRDELEARFQPSAIDDVVAQGWLEPYNLFEDVVTSYRIYRGRMNSSSSR
jgi:hypothetical protein